MIKPGQVPALAFLLRAAQHVEMIIHEHMAADFRSDRDVTENLSADIQLEDAMLVPLAEVERLTVKAQVGAGKFGQSDAVGLIEAVPRMVTPQVAIILRPFPGGEINGPHCRNGGPRNAGGDGILHDGPCPRVDTAKAASIAGADPQDAFVPGQSLWGDGGRRLSSTMAGKFDVMDSLMDAVWGGFRTATKDNLPHRGFCGDFAC